MEEKHQPVPDQPVGGKMFAEDQFVDLVPFPVEFESAEEALTTYNDIGLWHKCQFKLLSRTNNDCGTSHGFTLACARRGNVRTPSTLSATKVTQGLQLKDCGEVPCNVAVRFRWHQ